MLLVAGFSGTELSTIVSPQITTIEPPLEEMDRTAAELVIEKISNPEVENRKMVLVKTMMLQGIYVRESAVVVPDIAKVI